MKSKRYKLEIEMYGTEVDINNFLDQLDLTPFTADEYGVDILTYPSNFSPKKFWKLCGELENRFYKHYFAKIKKKCSIIRIPNNIAVKGVNKKGE